MGGRPTPGWKEDIVSNKEGRAAVEWGAKVKREIAGIGKGERARRGHLAALVARSKKKEEKERGIEHHTFQVLWEGRGTDIKNRKNEGKKLFRSGKATFRGLLSSKKRQNRGQATVKGGKTERFSVPSFGVCKGKGKSRPDHSNQEGGKRDGA